jgi:hypothetical protein
VSLVVLADTLWGVMSLRPVRRTTARVLGLASSHEEEEDEDDIWLKPGAHGPDQTLAHAHLPQVVAGLDLLSDRAGSHGPRADDAPATGNGDAHVSSGAQEADMQQAQGATGVSFLSQLHDFQSTSQLISTTYHSESMAPDAS